MKKILILLLLMVSTSVFAEWTRVGKNTVGDKTIYVDTGTIKRKGNKVKMWTLYDFNTVRQFENSRYLSQMERDEYDCEEETSALLDFLWYSGNMKNGDIVFSSTNIKNEAESIIPESIDETLFKIACGKK